MTWTLTADLGPYSPTLGMSTTLDAVHTGSAVLRATLVSTPSISATATITVTPGSLHQFAFDLVLSPQTAGQAFAVTITAQDAHGNTVTSYVGSATLTDSTGTITPSTTGSFINGQWSGDVTITRAQDNVIITAQDGTVSGSSNPFDVDPGPLHHFVFDLVPSPQVAFCKPDD